VFQNSLENSIVRDYSGRGLSLLTFVPKFITKLSKERRETQQHKAEEMQKIKYRIYREYV